jgi:hypothetical protein
MIYSEKRERGNASDLDLGDRQKLPTVTRVQ